MSYETFRSFADSWGLVLMGVAYLVFVGWAFLPRNRKRVRDASMMIFEDRDDG